mgnify:FL=1|tara:strand:- start:1781 stop:2434 length:654 start_codon:yes stop_codon:yes gene_type:complete
MTDMPAILNGSMVEPHTDFLYKEQIDDDVIDEFLSWYYLESDKWFKSAPGESLGKDQGSKEEGILASPMGNVNYSIKESMDTPIMNNVLIPPVNKFVEAVDAVTNNYVLRFPFAAKSGFFHMDEGWNVQWYPPGGGYKDWHTERSSSARTNTYRHLVWMVYLNDVPNGGTEWFHQQHYEEAKRGSCCVWPADWTYTHKGRVSMEHDKLIATGWYSFA